MAEDDDDDESEALASTDAVAAPPPRENTDLIGHEAAEAALLASFRSGRLPHAWLISGPRGIGKATLAFRFARFLFARSAAGPGLFEPPPPPTSLEIIPDNPVFRRVASGGHADLLVVERGLNKQNRLRTEIVVGDTRIVASFLRLTPAEGGWRVVIIDGADAMNRNAANAVLKILEEPPQRAVLLLVSDNPGRLLPTIRSRCRSLAMKPLTQPQVEAALIRWRGDLGAEERAALARLAEGSIGRALSLAGAGGMNLYRNIFKLLERLPEIDGDALSGFADGLARRGGEEGFALVAELLPGWLARMVALAAGGEGEGVLPGEAAAMRRISARAGLDHWVTVWENLTHLFAEADSINLDRKQVVLNAFFALEAAAR